jgi:hypothetical protein
MAGATSTQKVWVDSTQKGVTTQHMSRDALLQMATALQNVTRFSRRNDYQH